MYMKKIAILSEAYLVSEMYSELNQTSKLKLFEQ